MAPQRRSSGGSGPQQQRSIASFFSPASKKAKPVLHIGFPAEDEAKRKKLEDEGEDDGQLKRPRVSPGEENCEEMQPCENVHSSTLPIERPSSPPESKIGKRLKVYWPEEGKWFLGAVESYDGVSGKHKIAYDDGDEEVLFLAMENIEWLNGKQAEHGQERSPRSSANGTSNCSSLQSCSLKVGPESRDLINGKKKRLTRRRKQYVAHSSDDSDSQMPDVVCNDGEDWLKTDIHANNDEQELLAENESKDTRRDQKRIRKLSAQRRRLTKPRDELQVPEVELENKKIEDVRNSNSEREALEQKSAKLLLEAEMFRAGQDANSEANVLESYGSDQAVVLTGEALERFGGRVAEKFKFLGKRRRDAAGRRPESPRFDPRTLFLPNEFLKGLTGGQRQWWEFKAKHMDKVLLFKMGKFYEMFEMDAHIGAQNLDLQYMKFDQPHCGFPEKNYSENVERLARKGYRVLVVEQTETPEQLEIRKRKTGTKDKVVRREICAVITKGTMVDADMVGDNADTAYLLATTEKHDDEGGSLIGICVADTSRALFMLGEVRDDSARTKLSAIVSELRPVELVKPHGLLSEATERVLHEQTRKPLINNLIPYEEFWSAERTVKEINVIYSDARQESERVPHLLRKIIELGADGEPALSAFGGCVSYLKQALLDGQLLKLGRIELLPGSDILAESTNSDDLILKVDVSSSKTHCSEPVMVLDSAALENLEILENSSNGGVSGTLLSLVDHCVTPFGRRLLKQWIVRPLIKIESIVERQNALQELQEVAETAVSDFRKELTGIPDIERLLARLSASSGANGRHAGNVVLYEDAARKQTKELIAALCGCQTMVKAVSCFAKCLSQLKSVRLQFLLTSGRGFPDLKPLLQYFENAFDWSDAQKAGRVALHEGIDSNFDEASPAISDVKEELESYLESQRKLFNNSEISYVSVGKDSYLVEIPDQLHPKVPAEYELRSSRKGYRRYWTPKVKELLQKLTSYEDQQELASKGILQMLIKRFCEDHKQWLSAVRAISELDALMSLSCASLHMDGKVCKPIFTPANDSARPGFETMVPSFNAKALRHPIAGLGTAAGCPFVPNDVVLGGRHAPHFMLLTGPNMGGKSTLIRQVCLAIILAQVGADVPAEMLQLSPTDRLFVRMGAKDHILSGQSTFLVELSETASMLRCASRNSFVALDELGRGTATSDGQAIAHAVLQHLAHTIQCRGMFSSHYHKLANEHACDPAIACHHMACKVGTGADGLDTVTFLYKLSSGPCPKSYGVNVARLAGMPEIVLHRAAIQSAKLEEEEQLKELHCQRNSDKALGDREVELIQDILNCDEDGGDLTSLWRNVRHVLAA